MSIPTTAKVALLPALDTPLAISTYTVPSPGPGEVLVENHAIALNPIEWKVQQFGYFVEKYPFVMGSDAAGVVVKVGEGVTKFGVGDKVYVLFVCRFYRSCLLMRFTRLFQGTRKEHYATYQQYNLVDVRFAAAVRLPDRLFSTYNSILTAAAGPIEHQP
jgi:NADPH:quinone reductase-like Zn-dependent oxidoreductase